MGSELFKDRSDMGNYVYTSIMFDAGWHEIYKLTKRDTFSRFSRSESAHQILQTHPEVAATGALPAT